MPEGRAAQLYLVTPPIVTLDEFAPLLAQLLDSVEIACVRLALATGSEDELARAADQLRAEAHARDVPLVIADHFRLAKRLGLDGVHLGDGPRHVRAAREALGAEAIVGAHARASRHDGMTAAEIGADYVSFGPVTATALGDGVVAPLDLFEWWSEMIEVPVVAEGGIDLTRAREIAAFADFLALGDEIWSHGDGPLAALTAYAAAIR
jgi:thiamine-phosphate pyrophosphorylase